MSKSRFTHTHDIFRGLLKETRLARDVTQMQLAARLGMPQSYVSKYETGERSLDFVETYRVCNALEVDFNVLVEAFLDRLPDSRPLTKPRGRRQP